VVGAQPCVQANDQQHQGDCDTLLHWGQGKLTLVCDRNAVCLLEMFIFRFDKWRIEGGAGQEALLGKLCTQRMF
jgi:hypothetical protein